MFEIPIDDLLTEELESAQDLGTEPDPSHEVSDGAFFATSGDQPIAFRLRDLRDTQQLLGPTEVELYKAYDLWVVPHRVSIIRRKGRAEITAVGIEVEYETGGKTCCIASLLPVHKFVERGSLWMRVQIGGNGEASPAVHYPTSGPLKTPLAGLSVQASVAGGIKFFFSASVATPDIQAVGLGSSRCEWRFDRDTEPLYGRDIQCWSVLVRPRLREEIGETATELKYRIRYYLNVRTLFLTTRRQSGWKTLSCKLEASTNIQRT